MVKMVLVAQPKRRPSVHEKRRSGHHHKKTPDYRETYWPYLPLGIIIGLGMLVNVFWPSIQQVLGIATNTSISGLTDETNKERIANGLGGLALNNRLNQAAQAKANDMAARNYWSHDTPDGNPPWVFFSQAGYTYTAAGENLAYGFDDSTGTVAAWMNSPGHRANILNTTFKEVGFGIANVDNYQESGPQTIIVAMYGTPEEQAVPTPAPSAPTPPPVATVQPITATPAETPNPSPAQSNEIVVAQGSNQPTKRSVQSQNVARVQLLSGNAAPWTAFAATVIMSIAVVIFILRHGLLWHRVLIKGERFVIKHHLLDVLIVAIGILGFILTRNAGSIY